MEPVGPARPRPVPAAAALAAAAGLLSVARPAVAAGGGGAGDGVATLLAALATIAAVLVGLLWFPLKKVVESVRVEEAEDGDRDSP